MQSETLTLSHTEIINTYKEIRKYTEELCAPLNKEDYVPQPVEYISPPKWHLAHTSWFFEAFVLKTFKKAYCEFNKDFSFLFNSYYNAAGTRILRANRGNITRPNVDEVYRYRKYVDQAMLQLMEEINSVELLKLIELGLNHEQQHQELLITDLKYILGHNPIFPVYREGFSLAKGTNTSQSKVIIEAGVYEIGYEGNGFHYDNERGKHKQFIQDCMIDDFLVTNGEYLEFIEDKGYERPDLWLDEAWSWINTHKINAPLYWHKIEDKWMMYKLNGLQKIKEDEILTHISFYEAFAFAEWKGKRLLTEFEWEIASEKFKWGKRWEWTYSSYLPYPGFKTAPGALGEYNGKFMINQMVLRGSSTATSPRHSRKTYRNFFHPHLKWQCTGIRLAEKQV